jgi:diguanylate cyclase (GGDEF)-like protein
VSACRVADLMTRNVVWVAAQAQARDVIDAMGRKRISCTVVCEAGVPVGIVTERDLVAKVVGRTAPDAALGAADLMSAPVVTIPEAMAAHEALELARARKIRHLPVVDGEGKLAGIVTQTDLLNAYVEHVEDLVAARTRELAEANRKLEALSLLDGLLGVGNRRALEDSLPRIHDAALRYDRPYSLALFDVDYFKKYNDRYGHVAGDEVLRRVAQQIAATARVADHVYRYGGEELVVVFPETPLERARMAAERMVEGVRLLEIPHEDSPAGHLTVSAGVDGVRGSRGAPRDWRDLVRAADEKLYRAKQAGRDRVV